MMYWLTDIILKELKLGFAEATVLEALHPVCTNFERVFMCDDSIVQVMQGSSCHKLCIPAHHSVGILSARSIP